MEQELDNRKTINRYNPHGQNNLIGKRFGMVTVLGLSAKKMENEGFGNVCVIAEKYVIKIHLLFAKQSLVVVFQKINRIRIQLNWKDIKKVFMEVN